MNYRMLYLTLAVLGGVVPYIFFIMFIQQSGLNFQAFYEAAFANGAAAGLTSDLLISSLVFWIATIELWRRDKGPMPWVFIAFNLVIGLSFALPLYLFVRHMTRPASTAA